MELQKNPATAYTDSHIWIATQKLLEKVKAHKAAKKKIARRGFFFVQRKYFKLFSIFNCLKLISEK